MNYSPNWINSRSITVSPGLGSLTWLTYMLVVDLGNIEVGDTDDELI